MKMLKKLSINPEKVIKNEELVNLKGGYGNGTCAAISGSGTVQCNLSKTEAIWWAECSNPDGTDCVGNWCCDSCSSASWYNC